MKVVWIIDIDGATSPRHAALSALDLMQRPTTATVFEVVDRHRRAYRVDLGGPGVLRNEPMSPHSPRVQRCLNALLAALANHTRVFHVRQPKG